MATGPIRTRPRMNTRRAALAAAAFAAVAAPVLAASPASAAAFGAGNVAVCRIGTGSAALTSAATEVFIDELTPAGALVQTIALPTTSLGLNSALTASGTATSECLLTRSSDGQYLVITGYNAAAGTASVASSASASTARVIGRISAAGIVDTSTALTNFSTGNNVRSATSVNGTSFWVAGAASSPGYAALGATSSTQISTSLANLRQVNIFGGQLYSSDSSGTTLRLGAIGSGLPTTAGQTITNLPGFPITGSPYGFFFADLNAGVAGVDTLYVADDTPGTIQKYSLVTGTWVANGTISMGTVRGLTGVVTGNSVTLYATAGLDSARTLQTLTDTAGYNANNNGTATTIKTAGTNTVYRGVALAPVSAPDPVVPEAPLSVLLPATMLALVGAIVAIRRPWGRTSAA